MEKSWKQINQVCGNPGIKLSHAQFYNVIIRVLQTMRPLLITPMPTLHRVASTQKTQNSQNKDKIVPL